MEYKIINNQSNEIYLSETTKRLIDKGYRKSEDTVTQISENHYRLHLEPIFNSTIKNLQDKKTGTLNLTIQHRSSLIIDSKTKGPKNIQFGNDCLIVNNEVILDFDGNLMKSSKDLNDLIDYYNKDEKFKIIDGSLYQLSNTLREIPNGKVKGKTLPLRGINAFNNGIVSYCGDKYSKAIIRVYDKNGELKEEVALRRGFRYVSNSNKYILAYKEGNGELELYDENLNLGRTVMVAKRRGIFAISEDSNFLAISEVDKNTVSIYNLLNSEVDEIKTQPKKSKSHPYSIRDLYFPTYQIKFFNSENLIIGGDKHRLINYNVRTKKLIEFIGFDNSIKSSSYDGIQSIKFVNNKILSANSDYTWTMHSLEGQLLSKCYGHTNKVLYLESFKDKIMSKSVDGTTVIWENTTANKQR